MQKICSLALFVTLFLGSFLTLCFVKPAFAHFGLVIPSQSTIMDQQNANLSLDIAFLHPMEQVGMQMVKPKDFFVKVGEQKIDLNKALQAKSILGQDAWTANYQITKPGVYQFVVEPTPYFEEAEDCFIIHYTKTIVAAFGEEEDWDKPAGVKSEIVALTRPFANYTGNVFRGQVLFEGKPVANAMVEVEYYNVAKQYQAPNDYFVTQSVKTDAQGIFTFNAPFAGWWGFSALSRPAQQIMHQGVYKDVEIGAVLWLEFIDPQFTATQKSK